MVISNDTYQEFIRARDKIQSHIETRTSKAKEEVELESFKLINNSVHEMALLCISFIITIVGVTGYLQLLSPITHGFFIYYATFIIAGLTGFTIRLWIEGNKIFTLKKNEIEAMYIEESEAIYIELPLSEFNFLFSTYNLGILKSLKFSQMSRITDETWLGYIASSQELMDRSVITPGLYRTLLKTILCNLNEITAIHEKSLEQEKSKANIDSIRNRLDLE